MQMADELPMIYSVLIWVYCLHLVESDSSPGSLRKQRFTQFVMFLASVGYSVLHVYLALVTAFQLYFTTLIVIGVGLITVEHEKHTGMYTAIGLVCWPSKGNTRLKLRHKEVKNMNTLVRFYFILLLAGTALWLTDQHVCSLLHNLPFGLPNPQLHAWWHVLTGLSHHYGIQFAVGTRIRFTTKRLPTTVWTMGGVVPVTTPSTLNGKKS